MRIEDILEYIDEILRFINNEDDIECTEELEEALKDLRYELCLKHQIDAPWVISQVLQMKGEWEWVIIQHLQVMV